MTLRISGGLLFCLLVLMCWSQPEWVKRVVRKRNTNVTCRSLILPHTITTKSVLENNKIRTMRLFAYHIQVTKSNFYWRYIRAQFAQSCIWAEPIEQTGSMVYRLFFFYLLTRTNIWGMLENWHITVLNSKESFFSSHQATDPSGSPLLRSTRNHTERKKKSAKVNPNLVPSQQY